MLDRLFYFWHFRKAKNRIGHPGTLNSNMLNVKCVAFEDLLYLTSYAHTNHTDEITQSYAAMSVRDIELERQNSLYGDVYVD